MKSKVMSSVLNNYYKKERFGDVLQVLYPEVTFHQRKFPLTKNYWQHEDNRRNFFIEYAEANHFDPLVPSNWYRITKRDVTGFRGAAGALSYYGNSVRKALLDLFPNIGFVEAKFRLFAGDHDLRDENKQRSWFINFAKEKGFDPLIPNHWYHVKRSDFSNSQEAQALLVIYKYSLPKALMHLFPDIGLIKENFSTFQKGYWEDKENQKRAFIEHAKIHNFDSSNISNWLTTSNKSRFLKTKAGAAILDLYEKDWDTALRSIFPAQWMEKSETPNKIGHFVLVDNRKQFFMNFAAKKSFDPYVLTNWTPAMVREVKREKRASTVLAYYHGTVGKAIEQLFTDRPTESVS